VKYETRTAFVIVLVVGLFFLTSLCKKRNYPLITPITIPFIIQDFQDEDYDDEIVYESDLEFYCVVQEPEITEVTEKEQDENIR
jgi:hypothetical protein